MDVLRSAPRPGLAILMEKLGILPSSLDPEDLAMKIIPCLNAAGRLYFADLAVKILFNADDLPDKVDKIIELNKKRRELSSRILEQVDGEQADPYQYVLTDKDWSVGVLSSVASRICSERNAPVALVPLSERHNEGDPQDARRGDAVGIPRRLPRC